MLSFNANPQETFVIQFPPHINIFFVRWLPSRCKRWRVNSSHIFFGVRGSGGKKTADTK